MSCVGAGIREDFVNIDREELFSALFEGLEDAAFIVMLPSRKILACNPAAEEMFGYDSGELIGKDTRLLHVDEEAFKRFDDEGIGILRRDGILSVDYALCRKDGMVFPTRHRVVIVKLTNGQEVSLSIIEDRTPEQVLVELPSLIDEISDLIKSEARDLDVIRQIIGRLGGALNLSYGEVWIRQGSGVKLLDSWTNSEAADAFPATTGAK
ncbi:MAG: PAS domain S-box protein, partial [Alphaproteobacteria bacterium]|nr:PAS domain S-box protein [Alphaproteobacteria bacterium]